MIKEGSAVSLKDGKFFHYFEYADEWTTDKVIQQTKDDLLMIFSSGGRLSLLILFPLDLILTFMSKRMFKYTCKGLTDLGITMENSCDAEWMNENRWDRDKI